VKGHHQRAALSQKSITGKRGPIFVYT